MTAPIISRRLIGLSSRVVSFNRVTARPLLAPARSLIVAHYTGTRKRYNGLDWKTIASIIRDIDRWKPNEYNYVIDWDGRVYEFAGEYQAAHAKGFNATGYGVLFLNGVDEPMTEAELNSFHALFGLLIWTGRVQAAPMVVGHQEIAATQCPDRVMHRINEMRTYDPSRHTLAS